MKNQKTPNVDKAVLIQSSPEFGNYCKSRFQENEAVAAQFSPYLRRVLFREKEKHLPVEVQTQYAVMRYRCRKMFGAL